MEPAQEEAKEQSKPLPLPPLARLDLRDNCIDSHSISTSNEGELTFEPVIAMRAVKRLAKRHIGIRSETLVKWV